VHQLVLERVDLVLQLFSDCFSHEKKIIERRTWFVVRRSPQPSF
jgi:hypothetical protein